MKDKIMWGVVGIVILAGGFILLNYKKPAKNNPTTNNNTTTTAVANPCSKSDPANRIVRIGESGKGSYLTNGNCMTLYVNDNDEFQVSACYDACLDTWTPYANYGQDIKGLTADPDKRLNNFKRTDGIVQFAIGKQPVYLYTGDKKPGDMNGDGKDGIWHIVPLQSAR